jgi:hypothetical protein
MVTPQRSADIVVEREFAIGENGAPVAVLPNRVGVVGHENYVGAQHALAERLSAFAAKALVPDFGYLIDQIKVKIDPDYA